MRRFVNTAQPNLQELRQILYLFGNSAHVRWRKLEEGRHLNTFTKHTSWVTSVTFSPDGKTLANGSWDNSIRVWDAGTGKHISTLTGHTAEVTSVAFSPDGKTLASGSRTILLWDLTFESG